MTVLSKPICIIPARSGSSRIKNKNIYKIDGIPMIGHVIKILIKSKIFKKIDPVGRGGHYSCGFTQSQQPNLTQI